MKVIAINGSPRTGGNTATLLNHALEGARYAGAATPANCTITHLYNLSFKGCVSCFGCKLKGAEPAKCFCQDELSPILAQIMESDVLLVGSPVYFGDITGETRSFLERLLFMNLSYNDNNQSVHNKSIASAFFFTMNAPEASAVERYAPLFEHNTATLERLLCGPAQYLSSFDTMQFDDYSKYAAGRFSEEHKKQMKETLFKADCEKAFEIGKALASGV